MKLCVPMLKLYVPLLFAVALLAITAFPSVGATPVVSSPKVEGSVNPDNVLSLTPAFAWTYYSTENQENYRIWVGTASGSSDMWDSGVVNSSASSATYAGSTLQYNHKYYWRVSAADNNHWSDNATGYFTVLGQVAIQRVGGSMWDTITARYKVAAGGHLDLFFTLVLGVIAIGMFAQTRSVITPFIVLSFGAFMLGALAGSVGVGILGSISVGILGYILYQMLKSR